MKKIMFNERYGLQRAAIDGTKPMTRRSVPDKWQQPLTEIFEACNYDYTKFWQHPTVQLIMNEKAPYKVGEVVAIAQSYKDCGYDGDTKCGWCYDENEERIDVLYKEVPGWKNKMFVRSSRMPNRILFTANKIERLQDISDEDCMLEGVKQWTDYTYCVDGIDDEFIEAREAFAALIDKVSGRGTWDSNPWVFAYSFELVK